MDFSFLEDREIVYALILGIVTLNCLIIITELGASYIAVKSNSTL